MEALLLSALGVALTLGLGGAGLRWALGRAERARLRRARVESIPLLRPARFAAARGRAVPVGEPLVSPFSGRPCVAFRVVRWRQERKGGFGPNGMGFVWVVDDDADWAPDFALDDGTGQALVRPSGHVRFDLVDAEPPPDAAGHVDTFRKRYGHERASFFAGFHSAVLYRETVIEVGQPVLVAGTAAASIGLDANDERDGHRASPRPIELRPSDEPLYIGDGRRPEA
ncbi:hypothetical protein WMF45_12295 [Sorangium sp. So ce448]|uniref:hypothetical protein n=1 Tax=Sorangium sp. So ce448 TaxID=3133314 RepID=UPI003F62293B